MTKRWIATLAGAVMTLAAAASFAVDIYPSPSWPGTSTVLGLNATTDEATGLPYIAIGTSPESSPSLRVQYDRRLQRQNQILAAIRELQVVAEDVNTIGVYPGDYTLAGTRKRFAGATGQGGGTLTGTDTYYVYLNSSNALQIVTDGTGWPAAMSSYVPLAEVTVAASEITGIADRRNYVRTIVVGSLATQDANSVAITGGTITGITDLAVADGGTGASNPTGARTNLGLGSMATQAATNVAITGGTITGITDLAVADGGTGASDAAGARTNLGLVIGTHVQGYDADLGALAALAVTDGNFIVGDGTNWVAETGATARTSLGLGSMATQAANSVAITGGSIAGITDLPVADGGTGASDASAARTNLGLVIGTHVQAWDAQLNDLAGLAVTDSNFIVGDGTNWIAETGATARTSLGLGSMATQAANNVAITGGSIAGITDLPVADGGTGASDASAARTNLGLVIGTNVEAADADLTALAAVSTNGLLAHTGAGTASARTLTAGTGITVSNGDGASGNPTVGITDGGVGQTQLADAIQDLLPKIAISSSAQTGQYKTVTLQVQEQDATNIAGRFNINFWISSAQYNPPQACDDITNMVPAALVTVVSKAYYFCVTDANGTLSFRLTDNAGGTWYVHGYLGGPVYIATVVIAGP